MATKTEMEAVIELQRLAMSISAQGSFHVHTCYWGHTDEFRVWANDASGRKMIVAGWGHHDHSYYLGRDESGISKCANTLTERFLVTDDDGVPM